MTMTALLPEPEFRLMPGEDADIGLKRILLQDIVSLRAALAAPGDRASVVHTVRRRLKRVRSLLAALEPVAGADHDQRLKRARDTARLLAGARDADVMLATARRLAKDAEGEALIAANRLLDRLEIEADMAHAATVPLDEVAAKMRVLEADVASLPAHFDGERHLRAALVEVYRAGREHWREVDDGAKAHVMHDWRKHVKHRWHLTAILEGRMPIATKATLDDLDRLGEMLGREHDLAILKDRLERDTAAAGGEAGTDLLLELIRRRRRKLRKKAVELGEELYGERTKVFAKTLEI